MGHHEGRQGYGFSQLRSLLRPHAHPYPCPALQATNSSIAMAEFSGTLVGFDDYVSKLKLWRFYDPRDGREELELTCHQTWSSRTSPSCKLIPPVLKNEEVRPSRASIDLSFHSDYSGQHVKLPKILLNGNNICMVSPKAILPSPKATCSLTIILCHSSSREERGPFLHDTRMGGKKGDDMLAKINKKPVQSITA